MPKNTTPQSGQKRKADITRSRDRTKRKAPKTPKVKSPVIEKAKFDATGKEKPRKK